MIVHKQYTADDVFFVLIILPVWLNSVENNKKDIRIRSGWSDQESDLADITFEGDNNNKT